MTGSQKVIGSIPIFSTRKAGSLPAFFYCNNPIGEAL